ncbi:MAG: hypothetical protein U1D30_13000 [Planctomycetota bacterium]
MDANRSHQMPWDEAAARSFWLDESRRRVSGPMDSATVPLANADPSNSTNSDESPLDEELLGTRLDVYQILGFIGRGGMGRVYLGWHERLHRLCAVKVIDPELARFEPRLLDMFFAESAVGGGSSNTRTS